MKQSNRIIKLTIAMQSAHTISPYMEFRNMRQLRDFLSAVDFSMTNVGVFDFKLGYCYKFYLGDTLVHSDVEWESRFTMVPDGHIDDGGHVLARVQFPQTSRPTLVRIVPSHPIIRQCDQMQIYPPCRKYAHTKLAGFTKFLCYNVQALQR